MRWSLAIVALAACWTTPSPAPPSSPTPPAPPIASVRPPDGTGTALTNTVIVVDTGVALYVVKPTHDTSPVVVPAGTRALEIAELAAALELARVKSSTLIGYRQLLHGVFYVAAATTPANRVLRIADVLRSSGRCLIPAMTRSHDNQTSLVVAGSRCSIALPADDLVQLTVFATSTDDWIGLSRVNEFEEVPRRPDGHDLERIESLLKTHRTSAFFADRDDVELSADPGVTYGELVQFAAIVRVVGFGPPVFVSRLRASAIPTL